MERSIGRVPDPQTPKDAGRPSCTKTSNPYPLTGNMSTYRTCRVYKYTNRTGVLVPTNPTDSSGDKKKMTSWGLFTC